MINKVVFIGHLVRDTELKTTTNGTEVTAFSLAVQRNYKNSNNEYDTDFFNCVAYKNNAKYLNTYGGKGMLVAVEGNLQNRSYEKDGQKRTITEIIVESVNVLEKKENFKTVKKEDEKVEESNIEISEDDLPF